MKKSWKKNTAIFLSSQTISLFGSSLVQYAILWYITLETRSGFMMMISIICGFFPTLLFSPFTGVWADRYNRKMLIVAADTLIAVSTLALAILFLSGYKMLWLVFIMSAIRSAGTAVQTPAIGAFLPQFVPEEKLTKVNAINSSIQSLVMLASPMLSGALLTFSTIEIIFFIDVFTAFIAVLILSLFLYVPAHNKAQNKQNTGYFRDLKEGLNYIKNHEFMKKFFVFCGIFFFLSAPAAFLTPLQVARSFGGDVWRLTAIEVAFSLGMMFGGIIMAIWGGFKQNKVYSMTLGSTLLGFCTFALGVVPDFFIYLFFMIITGIGIPVFNTPATVLLQEKVEGDLLGRVFGILSMITSSVMPIAMLVFGPLADLIKIEYLLIVTGLLVVVQSLFLFTNKALLEAGKNTLR